MAKKMLNPNTTLLFIPVGGLVNPLEPSVAELSAASALNLSCAVVRGYTLNPTDSDVDDSASICDSGNVENRLYDNYEGEITFFREGDLNDNESVYAKAFEFFKNRKEDFWVVRRVGKKQSEAFVENDLVEVFKFATDNIRSVDGGDDGPVQFTAPMLQQGLYSGYVQVKA